MLTPGLTDWGIFKGATDEIHEHKEKASDDIGWCMSICAPPRSVHVVPNKKPWFNADTKQKNRKPARGDRVKHKRPR